MYETNLDGWDVLPNGNIEVSPVVGWEMGAAPGLVLLRLEIAVGPGQIGTAQLGIPMDAAGEMAKALQWWVQRERSNATPGHG